MRYDDRFSAIWEEVDRDPKYWSGLLQAKFADELEQKMEDHGLSRSKLARKVGVSPAYITEVFRGESNLTIESMVMFAFAVEERLHIEMRPVDDNWLHIIVDRRQFEPRAKMVPRHAPPDESEYTVSAFVTEGEERGAA